MRLPPKGLPEATLGFGVAEWIEGSCAIPDGEKAGEPFELTPEQLRFVLWFYAIDKLGNFVYRRAQLTRPQKWGKGPLSAAIICAEAAGPVLLDYVDPDGTPVGRPWPTPWIQVVAVSEDQTDNVWTALVPMIELGDLRADIPDTGKTRINVAGQHGSAGVIEPVTSAALSRLGQRLTFAVHDETHSWTQHNGGVKLADTQRRNLAGMGGRSLETTNAWDPSEASVAQTTFEADLPDVLLDYPEPRQGSFKNKRDRARILKHAYAGAPWVDLERIEAECQELLPRDPRQAERFFGNRIVAGADAAFDAKLFATRVNPDYEIPAGAQITLGFDGSVRHDATGLVATEVATGFQHVLAKWEKPDDVTDEDWEVPVAEVNDAVDDAFNRFDVWRLYGDPPYWQTEMDHWAGKYGADRVIAWWTNRLKQTAFAIKQWHEDWAGQDSKLTHDGDEALIRHVGNAVKHQTRMRDDDGSWLWVIRKDGQKSPRKIDLAMCAVLSWEARGDAIQAGALNKKTYERAFW